MWTPQEHYVIREINDVDYEIPDFKIATLDPEAKKKIDE